MTHRVERKIIRTVYDNPQSSMRELALQVEKDFGLRVSHNTIEDTNIPQEWLRENLNCQYKMSKRV